MLLFFCRNTITYVFWLFFVCVFVFVMAGKKFDILITTPLRLVHMIEKDGLTLDTVQYLVFDEADKLFELGFVEQIDVILAACKNEQLVRCLFSATLMPQIEQLARKKKGEQLLFACHSSFRFT